MGDTRLIPVKTITPQKSGVIVKLLYLFNYGAPDYTIKGLESEEDIGKFKHSLQGDLRDYFSSMNEDAYQSDFEDVFSRSDFKDKYNKFKKLLKDGNKDFVILSLQVTFIKSVKNSRLVFDFKAEKERLEMYEADLSGLNIDFTLKYYRKIEERPSKNEFKQKVNDNLFKEIFKTDNLFKLILKEACSILARNMGTLSSG